MTTGTLELKVHRAKYATGSGSEKSKINHDFRLLVDYEGERWTTKTVEDKDIDGDGYLEPMWDDAENRNDYMRAYQNINGSKTFTITLEEKTT